MMCSYLLMTLCMASPVNDAVPPTSSSSWRADAQSAKEAAARQDWSGAAAALKESHSSDSEINAILSYDLGVAAYRAGDYALAEKAFERASRTGSSSLAAAAAYNQGNAIIQQTPIAPSEQQSPAIDSNQLKQKYQAAIDAYRRALQAEPTLDDARANVEWAWSKLKQLEETEQQQQQNKDDQESQQEDSQEGSDSQQDQQQQQQQQQQQDGSQQNSAQQQSDSQQGEQQQDGSQQDSAQQQADSQQGQQQDGSQQDTPQQQGEPQQETSQQNPQQNPSQQEDKGQQQPSPAEQSGSPQENPEQSDPQQAQQNDTQEPGTGTSPPESANQEPNSDVSSSGTPQRQGRMTAEEAERMLQVIRDRERQRREQKRQQQTVGTAPTGKDW